MHPETLAYLKKQLPGSADVALVLGSGLGNFVDGLDVLGEVPAAGIPHYPASTVPGHAGRILCASISGRKVLIFQGRIHRYEGYSYEEVVLPVRIARAFGVKAFIATNAAGGLNPYLPVGSFMLITGFLILPMSDKFGAVMQKEIGAAVSEKETHLLTGGNACSMDTEAEALALNASLACGVPLKQGTYAYVTGPSYETRSEIAFLRRAGADAVGMSTVPELMDASMHRLRTIGISCITNSTSTMKKVVSHEEVTSTALRVSRDFSKLLKAIIERL
jgi:purine-nucleoside phosphorylase